MHCIQGKENVYICLKILRIGFLVRVYWENKSDFFHKFSDLAAMGASTPFGYSNTKAIFEKKIKKRRRLKVIK